MKQSRLKFYQPKLESEFIPNKSNTIPIEFDRTVKTNVSIKQFIPSNKVDLNGIVGGQCTDSKQCRVKYDNERMNEIIPNSAYFSCGGNICHDSSVGNIDSMNKVIMPESSRSTGYLSSEYVNDLFLDMKESNLIINRNILTFPRGGESTRRTDRIE